MQLLQDLLHKECIAFCKAFFGIVLSIMFYVCAQGMQLLQGSVAHSIYRILQRGLSAFCLANLALGALQGLQLVQRAKAGRQRAKTAEL